MSQPTPIPEDLRGEYEAAKWRFDDHATLEASAREMAEALRNYRQVDHSVCILSERFDNRCTTCKIADAALAAYESAKGEK